MRGRAVVTVGAVVVMVAGCGSSSPSTPDVSGGPASNAATLFKATNLRRVLNEVRHHLSPTAQITTIKIEPRDVKVITTNSVVTVDNSGRSLTVKTPAIPALGGSFTLSSIDPQVVQQVAANAAAASHSSLRDVAYVASVPNPISHTTEWGVYMTNQRHFLANLDGTQFHVIGTATSAALSSSQAGGGGSGGKAGGKTINPQKIAACIQKAGSDPTKIAACTTQ
jgi:hypothetical protein